MKKSILMILCIACVGCNASNKKVEKSLPHVETPAMSTQIPPNGSTIENSLDNTIPQEGGNVVPEGGDVVPEGGNVVPEGGDVVPEGGNVVPEEVGNGSPGTGGGSNQDEGQGSITDEETANLDYYKEFNELISGQHTYRDSGEIHLNGYLLRGTRNMRKVAHKGDVQVLYRYILADEFAKTTDPYDYKTTDAPDFDQLYAEGYRRAVLDNGKLPPVPLSNSIDTVPILLYWSLDGAKYPEVRHFYLDDGTKKFYEVKQMLVKSDEKIYDPISHTYKNNDFTNREIVLNSDTVQVQWVDQSPYVEDSRFKKNGTKVILWMGLYVEFYDVLTSKPFYRLISFDIEKMKSYPQDYTYIITN